MSAAEIEPEQLSITEAAQRYAAAVVKLKAAGARVEELRQQVAIARTDHEVAEWDEQNAKRALLEAATPLPAPSNADRLEARGCALRGIV